MPLKRGNGAILLQADFDKTEVVEAAMQGQETLEAPGVVWVSAQSVARGGFKFVSSTEKS